MLSIFERDLPECLPKRYGLFEPPQHVYEKTGKEHFLNFLDENLRQPRHRAVVWYPHRPVAGLHFSIPNPRGPHKLGFRTGHLRIDVERQILAEPGWAVGLMRLWRNVSKLIRPIYGDVRMLDGYIWMGATVGTKAKGVTHTHPVGSWWWAGIPERLGLAVVLGEVYRELWPSFVGAARVEDGLAFLSLDDWSLNGDLTEVVGKAPEDQLMRPKKTAGTIYIREIQELMKVRGKDPLVGKIRREYPSGWPFDGPYTS